MAVTLTPLEHQIVENRQRIIDLELAVASARLVKTTLRALYRQITLLEERIKGLEARLEQPVTPAAQSPAPPAPS